MYGGGGVFVFFAIGVDLSFIHLSLSALAVSCPARVGRICPLRFIAYARARFVVDFCRGLLGLGVGTCLCVWGGPAPLSCVLYSRAERLSYLYDISVMTSGGLGG